MVSRKVIHCFTFLCVILVKAENTLLSFLRVGMRLVVVCIIVQDSGLVEILGFNQGGGTPRQASCWSNLAWTLTSSFSFWANKNSECHIGCPLNLPSACVELFYWKPPCCLVLQKQATVISWCSDSSVVISAYLESLFLMCQVHSVLLTEDYFPLALRPPFSLCKVQIWSGVKGRLSVLEMLKAPTGRG